MATANPYLKDFRSFLHDRFSDDSKSMTMTTWLEKNTTLNKKPFTTAQYPFQRTILDDLSPDLTVIKPSQVGLSELSYRKAAGFLTRNQGTSLILALPTEAMFKRMSNTRIMPMLSNDRVFDIPLPMKPIRRADLMQIGHSFLYMVGGSEAGATSIPADFVMIDEIDLADPDIVSLYSSRLQNSDWKITQRLSTPTFEGFGISAFFEVSNQNEYFIKCPGCNTHNAPKWTPEHIHIEGLSSDINDLTDISQEMFDSLTLNDDTAYVVCTHCGYNLSPYLAESNLREWVPAYPSRSAVGYRVSPFSTDRLPVSYILNQQMHYARSGSLRRFYNTTLGVAYDDSDSRLSELDIKAAMGDPRVPEISKDTPVVVGIDVGLTCHITIIALPETVISFEAIPSRNLPTRVEEILNTYNVLGGCIDRYPDTSLSNEVRDLSNGLILPVEYASPNSSPINLVLDELGDLSHVRGNRTMMLDETAQRIRKRRLRMEGYKDHHTILIHHLKSQVRLESPDSPAVWRKTDGVDHFAHALTYGLFAIRVHNLQNHQNQSETRTFFSISTVTPSHLSGDRLGMPVRYAVPT